MVIIMAYKFQGKENRKFNLNESILITVGEMQPISSEEILLEIEEVEERKLSRLAFNHQLEKMLENDLLAEVTLKNGGKGYITVKQ